MADTYHRGNEPSSSMKDDELNDSVSRTVLHGCSSLVLNYLVGWLVGWLVG
jgi:hypothetical protein